MNIDTMSTATRTQGVNVSPGQVRSAASGLPKTLSNITEAKTFAIQYVDDAGTPHITFALLVGDAWYIPPNGENYASSLRLASSWMAKALNDRYRAHTAAVIPSGDVDVVGT